MIGYVVQGKIFKAVQQTKCSNVQLSVPLHLVHFSPFFPPSIMQLSFFEHVCPIIRTFTHSSKFLSYVVCDVYRHLPMSNF